MELFVGVSRATSVSWLGTETPRLRTVFDALLRFGLAPLRRRALADWLLAMERRRIAHPKGLGLRRIGRDYSRDLRSAKWGSEGSLHGSNCKPPMSALGKSGRRGVFDQCLLYS